MKNPTGLRERRPQRRLSSGGQGRTRSERALRNVPERTDAPARVSLALNGEEVGEKELVEGWSEYVFDIPEDHLRAGLNEIVLTYSVTPRMIVPDLHGWNAVLAVDWIDFR